MNQAELSAQCAKFGLARVGNALILPRKRLDGKIVTAGGQTRCTIVNKTIANHDGRYSLIWRATHSQAGEVAIKRPRNPVINLTNEALLQSLAHEALNKEGMPGAVPEVFDLFMDREETHFSMEWIEGMRVDKALIAAVEAGTVDEIFQDILLQLAAILYSIHRRVYLDHRDMRVDNIWVRARPVNYTVRGNNFTRIISSPRQIVLLDFGFACLGDSSRRMSMNLGNAIPDTDWCPKPGRDMYTIINNLLDVSGVYDSISPALRSALELRMAPFGRSNPYRMHLDTSDPRFELRTMIPEEILRG